MRPHKAMTLLALASALSAPSLSQAAAPTFNMRVPAKGLRPTAPAAAPAPPGPFQFTTCGATGAYGPSAGQCASAYSGSPLAGNVSVAAGIQTWTVPTTGSYTITLAGGHGGNAITAAHVGAAGAVLTTRMTLTAGWVFKILVGQAGVDGVSDAGGGGGSYIVLGSSLQAAAGGGGGGGASGGDGYAASINTTATLSHGSGNGWGGGGAGFDTNGVSDSASTTIYGGQSFSFISGGVGGGVATNACGANYQAQGGFGGGGGGGCAGGGSGGGYSVSSQGDAGGTTYSSGTIISSVTTNPGAGYVTFSKD